MQLALGPYQAMVDDATAALRDHNIMARIWEHDHTVWSDQTGEITNRLGWLTIADHMAEADTLQRLASLVDSVKTDGITHVLLLGMGGSSLAPEVFSRTFGPDVDGLQLSVLDSTDPGYVLQYKNTLPLAHTLFIVATKSGGTAETLSAFKFFYNQMIDTVGRDKAGRHFIAITDPRSKLESIADRYRFRATFLNDPNIGGRYSALSFFGLVPAALVGVDVARLLDGARTMAANCAAENCPADGDNLGGILGAVMGETALAGRDKLTFALSAPIAGFGDWVEQLIAESTGKAGVGIVPIVGEPLAEPTLYRDDRVFVGLHLDGDTSDDAALAALEAAGHPVVRITLSDKYDLGGQFFLWEMATAVAGHLLAIQPFDQPNVEAAKVLARQMIQEYEEKGALPALTPALTADGIAVYGETDAATPAEALTAFLQDAPANAYIALQAYVHPTPETDAALHELRLALRERTRFATTVGYGPRFLHSTGQLHKGDGGHGQFIQITAAMPVDAPIPDEAGDDASAMTFGTLKEAQALGDRAALLDANRRVIRFTVGEDVAAGLRSLLD